MKIAKNDTVEVISGAHKGRKGKVLKVYPNQGKAVVERINMIKRHTRANPGKQVQGGIVEREAPISISNLKVICTECGKPSRMGRLRLDDGSAVRVCRACGATLK